MPIRVEPSVDAVEDLVRYAESGNLPLFLKKLLGWLASAMFQLSEIQRAAKKAQRRRK